MTDPNLEMWRESASPEVQADLDGLFDAVVPFASQTVEKHGSLLPFAQTVDIDGATGLQSALPSDDPVPGDVLDLLASGLRTKADDLPAVAVASDVKLVDGRDAIRMDLEHREGEAITVVSPTRGADCGGAQPMTSSRRCAVNVGIGRAPTTQREGIGLGSCGCRISSMS
ncbi:MAG: hypothetical protein ACRD29_02740 [Acidimicrobiales bacterium]